VRRRLSSQAPPRLRARATLLAARLRYGCAENMLGLEGQPSACSTHKLVDSKEDCLTFLLWQQLSS
jgi:hypothetical protein